MTLLPPLFQNVPNISRSTSTIHKILILIISNLKHAWKLNVFLRSISPLVHETIGNSFSRSRGEDQRGNCWKRSVRSNFERRFPLNRNPMETSLRRLRRNSTTTKGRTPLRRYDPPQNASGKGNPSSPVSKVNGVEVKELARIHSRWLPLSSNLF